MPFVLLFIASFVIGFLLQLWRDRPWVSLLVPCAAFGAAVQVDAYVIPHRGAGAEFWPIALLFGFPVIVVGAAGGALTALLLRRYRRGIK
jgi:hypothetical protein